MKKNPEYDALEPEDNSETVPPEVAEQMWQDAVEAFHGVGPYALENQDI